MPVESGEAGRGWSLELSRKDPVRSENCGGTTVLPSAGSEFRRADQVDETALFEAILAEHGSALRAFALQLTGDGPKADDVVQETLVRAWRHPEALDGRHGSPRGWLFTVARRLAVDSWRRDQSRRRREDREASPIASVEFEQLVDDWVVAAAVERLSPQHRAVLVQTVWLGRSVAETADVLGIPPGTVKSRTYYALRAVRLALDEMGFVP